MTSDDARRQQDTPYRPVGTGHASSWRCASCGKLTATMAGRRAKRVRGVKTWICVHCAGGRT